MAEEIETDKKIEDFHTCFKKYSESTGTGPYQIWITLSHQKPGDEADILTIINRGNELAYFRSGITAVIVEESKQDRCRGIIYEYLENGYEIQYLSPECCAAIWDHVFPFDALVHYDRMRGIELFLTYCRENDITQEYLSEKVGREVDDVLRYLKVSSAPDIESYSKTAIPETVDVSKLLNGDCFSAGISEWEEKQIVDFIKGCYALNYTKQYSKLCFECLVAKRLNEEALDMTAFIKADDETIAIRQGRIPRRLYCSSEELERSILQALDKGYHIQMMTFNMHGDMWTKVSGIGQERQKYEKGIQLYAEYCKEHHITKGLLSAVLNQAIPDFMQKSEALGEKIPRDHSGRHERKR